MKAAHTPGPWVVEDSRKFRRKRLRSSLLMVVAENGGMPGLIVNQREVTPTDEANARLIAAAPDLLAALTALVAAVSDPDADSLYELAAARAAIKKARK